ncbi:MAG: hypothetical protein M3Z00_01660 [Actinomycetota bacterium]|nr:hypothetical protein [Actinomycetota bacterium]
MSSVLAGRWLLIGLVLSGVVAMHVLSEPATSGGHGMMMDARLGQSAPMMHDQDGGAAASMGSAVPQVMATDGSMAACCILFLVAGAAAAMAAMLISIRARAAVVLRQLFAGVLDPSPRGPPGRRPPRISLCVQRV